jgi:hypothetical protein
MVRIFVWSVASLFVLIALAACGGGNDEGSDGSSNSSGIDNSKNSSNGGGDGTISEADCDKLGQMITEVQFSAALGDFDYEKLRTFFNDFDPSSQVEDDFNRLKDNINRIASAFEDAGVKSGDQPVGDQIDELQEKLETSESDAAENSEAITSVDAWRQNGCD